jgi:CRISPR-associated protein Cmr3
MTSATLRFSALDTLFFREPRPFEAIGGSELASVFPPPPRTMAGAIRSAIGDALGADWNAFHEDHAEYTVGGFNLHDIIGYGDDLGRLSVNGIWLSEKGRRLYPPPLFLLRKDNALRRFQIGSGEQTCLGKVRLPKLPRGCEGFITLENVWLTSAGLEKALAGGLPDSADIRQGQDLFCEEPRLGIARDNSRRTVKIGLLYQSRHIRPHKKAVLSIEVDVSGLDGIAIDSRTVRLGGQGRLAGIETATSAPFPSQPSPSRSTYGLILTLLTPARFGEQSWLPAGFQPQQMEGARVWQGEINSISLTVHCAVIGKATREGGWDMAAHAPRPVQSLIPAGSAWYCTVDDKDFVKAIKTLHGEQIGEDSRLGRGRIVCGLWPIDELITKNKGE